MARRVSPSPDVPAGAEVVARIPVAGQGGIGVGGGSVWVLDRGTGLLQLDPASNAVVAQVPRVIGAAPVVGEGAVWVPSGALYQRLLRVDVEARSFVQIATGPLADEYPSSAVVTAGAVWVGNHHGGTVARIDPRTNSLAASVRWGEVGNGGIYHLAADGSKIWATASRTSDVTEIDAATNSVVRRIRVPTGACGGISVDASAVWVASGYDEPYSCWDKTNWGVSRIDRVSGTVRRFDVGGRPVDVRIAFGSVWVVIDAPTTTLVRLDPASGRIVGRLQLKAERCTPVRGTGAGFCPGGPDYATALAVGFDSLWVRVTDELFRVAPR